ncbi:flagellar basal-body rod protein FlgG [Roseiterribacter gracilis]|uniref:Flagellar basal-body rod protein FlgG n=1 Tax=Roseiterribacter gracilis TaxID=2812848 RepID=A0A8S8XJY3_9PROT|nr:flagellar basal-body rod protein FlgG [Rhodospirillales bacterium TMPK1]
MRALHIASTGMLAQQTNVEVISNNIANLTTTGYKRQRAEFQDLLYSNIVRPGAQSSDIGTIIPSGIQLGNGVKTAAVYRINEQGTLQRTENKLDVGINGQGYFQVDLPNGEIAYTRDGTFSLDAQGQVVTQQGYLVRGVNQIPRGATDIVINEVGQMFVKLDGTTTPVQQGQFQMVTFPNPTGLEAIGGNLLLETPASGTPITGSAGDQGFGKLNQGAVENSNVNIVAEITSLITAQRAYEMNSKVVKAADDMLSAVNQLR